MLTKDIGATLRRARKALGITQAALARRALVTTRLVGELERGARPNVSLETALRIFAEVGITVRLTVLHENSVNVAEPASVDSARLARAAARRATWSGRQIRLRDEGREAPARRHDVKHIGAVARVSEQAFAIARATQETGSSANAALKRTPKAALKRTPKADRASARS